MDDYCEYCGGRFTTQPGVIEKLCTCDIENQKPELTQAKAKVNVEAEVMQKIIKTIDDKIFQEGIKHDNTMFSIKKEALEYFHQLYEFKIDFLKSLKKELADNFSA